MKKTLRMLLLLALLSTMAIFVFSQALTNQEVLEMVKAKVSPELIVKAIETAKSVDFDLSPKQLIALKNASVDDKIVTAMMTKASGNRGEPSSRPAPAIGNLPNAIGVFYRRGDEYQEIPQEMAKGRMSAGRLLMGPIVKQKNENKISGKTSNVLINEPNPRFLIHLPGRDVGKLEMISVLEVREDERVLFLVEGRVTGNIKRNVVAVAMEERGPGYTEIRPKESLPNGEYAIVDYEGVKIPSKVWAFSIKR